MTNNLFLIKRGGKPLCCPFCRKKDGKFYQVNQTEFRCSHCVEKLYIENIEDEQEEQSTTMMEEKSNTKYYVIYTSTDVGWYKTEQKVFSVVESEEVAKDFCDKFRHMYYVEVEVGKVSDKLISELGKELKSYV